MRNVSHSPLLAATLGVLLLLLLGVPTHAIGATAVGVVGEVVFAVGGAYLLAKQPTVRNEPLRRGDSLRVGDTVKTQNGSHVHVRFVDGAFVGIRPNSSMSIEEYRFDVTHPERSKVKFLLQEGTGRFITGRAGEAAKHQFRLNTPVAAVGVRGTDFVVQTDVTRTDVAVNTGTVVISALSQSCSVATLGPCADAQAKSLSADMAGFFARIDSGMVTVLPISGIKPRPPHPGEPPTIASGPRRERQVDITNAAQIATPGVLTAGELIVQPSVTTGSNTGTGSAIRLTTFADNTLSEQRIKELLDARAKQVPPVSSLTPSSLEWGRWALVPIPGETNPAPIIERADYTRLLVSDGVNAIFGPADARSVTPKEGVFDFTLRDFRVALMSDSGPTSGSIEAGMLNIDFAKGWFKSTLRANHADVAGAIVIDAQGPLRNDGLFRAAAIGPQDTELVGVIANAGKEAVYGFSTPVKTRSGSSSNFLG